MSGGPEYAEVELPLINQLVAQRLEARRGQQDGTTQSPDARTSVRPCSSSDFVPS